MKLKSHFLAGLFLVVTLSLQTISIAAAQTNITHLACIGDSITYGSGLKDRNRDSYPAQLARLLGDQWEVKNYGVSGTTMMKQGDRPFEDRKEYQAALDSKPEVVVIALGTNDSKPQNVEKNPDDFVPSYREMISKFRAANPNVKIYACLPPPAFPENGGIRDQIITETIIPMIQKVAKEEHVSIIDLHTPLKDEAAVFPDKVHPNPEGARLMAKIISEALMSNHQSSR
ncbi:MAG TPA: GDSL-type esterase/lipase family protein [Verrucomicrobiae bacterium]|nr:GDSL-type esterase/lipase family protein [Verrucomicrobiae bacterium]